MVSTGLSAELSMSDSTILTGIAPLDTAPLPPSTVSTLSRLFEHRARERPNDVAFSCQTGHSLKRVTYAEADAVAASLAAQLVRLFPNNDASSNSKPVVAIWLEKGLELILSILATTYSGATWLPFDPDVPIDRAVVCILDAGTSVILCDADHLERAHDVEQRVTTSTNAAGKSPLQVRKIMDLLAQTEIAAAPSRPAGPGPRDAAYLIYTSGTTGTPKGIAIPHSAALMFSLSEREVLGTSANDIVWNGFSPAFDMFVEEIDVGGLPSVWDARGVTLVNAVPTLIGIMGISQIDTDAYLLPTCIRLINLGGEACPPSLVKRLARPGLRIVNTYGPTETTVTATWDELVPDVAVTIGRPLPSYHACILPIPEDGQPLASSVPLELQEGTEGELAIGGPCVGLGYVGRADLTAQKFMDHPLAPNTSQKLYRTGDRVRLQADLKIAFLGRIDTQVKHRGFRIELGEIESRLSSYADVQAAAVILANPNTDTARLEAFVVIRPGAEEDVASIHQLAAQHLPAYMRPEEVYYLEANEMPRLPSGKINAKALHDVSVHKAAEALARRQASSDASTEVDVDIPETCPLRVLMKTLAAVFPQAGHIKVDADFFDDLGGHSLTAAVLVSRLRQAKSEEDFMPFASIGLPDIYEGRTPANIAARYTLPDDDDRSSTVFGSDCQDAGPQTGECWPVSPTKFILCGIAQIIPLLFLFFIASIDILVPYLLADVLIRGRNFGYAILGAYAVFVVLPVVLSILAVVGKWLVLGKAKEGEYPLYGVYYFRWWTAERLVGLANPKLIADSALYPIFLRAIGAKVGKFCHLGAMGVGAAADLLEIGDDVVVGADVWMAVSVVERGRLILKKVVIHNDAKIGSNTVVEGGAVVDEAADIGPLSMVADGMHIPSWQRWHGSPAQFERHLKDDEAALGPKTRPSLPRAMAMATGNFFLAVFIIPLLFLVPQIPGLFLFDAVDFRDISNWGQVAVLAMPIALAYQCLVFIQFIVLRRLFLGKLKEGKYKIYSSWYLRKWFLDRVFDLALGVLHPVFATLYIVPFLRVLGVKIGKRAEISTARGLSFELLEIGDESFVADAVLMGDNDVRGNELKLKKTTLEKRAFAGNVSLIPQGTTLASGTLVGVLSIAPPLDKPLPTNTSCFGSPPVFMPARQRIEGHADHLLFRPSKARIAARLTIEGLRIVLPRALIVFGLGFSLQIAYLGYSGIGAVHTLLMLPLFYMFMFALPALFFTVALKWILIGKYKPVEWPLWSLDVWLSEAVTSTYETITMAMLTNFLVGTPYLAMCFRLFGVKIGKRATLLHPDITEYDCVTIGDEAMVNKSCGAQTHLFEDRIMKIGRVHLGNRACLKPYSICLPGSTVSDDAQLGSLSLVMKSETLPATTAWEGAPVRPRGKRRRSPISSMQSAATTRTFSASTPSSRTSSEKTREKEKP